jgi:hypothetical protein
LLLASVEARAAGVVGSGTAASCTEAAFDAAFIGGGTVTFACGSAPVTITFTGTKVLTADTVIDGGGLVTLSGGDAVQLFRTIGWDLTLDSLTLRDGLSDVYGGAVRATDAIVAIIDSTVADNHVSLHYGGALAMFATGGSEARLAVVRSTFVGNSSNGYAGTIYASASAGFAPCPPGASEVHVLVLNSTFSGNSSGLDGSMLFADASAPDCPATAEVQVFYSTIAGNTGDSVFFLGPNASRDLAASVVGPNTSTNECTNDFGVPGSPSLGYNVTDDADCLGLAPQPTDQVVADTLLEPLAAYGGPTQTMALRANSAAVDAIPPGALECTGAVGSDQRGVPRPQGPDCDAGSFEAPWLVGEPTPVASGLPDASIPMPVPGTGLEALGSAFVFLALLSTVGIARARRC